MSSLELCRTNIGRLLNADCPDANAGTKAYFISFLRSRVDDPQEFYESLRVRGKYKVFGGKEKPADATSHYHLLLVLDGSMAVTDGVNEFKMWNNSDFQDEVDSYDIQVRVKRDEQYPIEFYRLVHIYMLHVIDPATCFGDQDLSLFAVGTESSTIRDAGGLFQIGDDAHGMNPLTYPRTKSIAAFLRLEYHPTRRLVCKCIEVCPGTRLCSISTTPDRARDDDVSHEWCDRARCHWY